MFILVCLRNQVTGLVKNIRLLDTLLLLLYVFLCIVVVGSRVGGYIVLLKCLNSFSEVRERGLHASDGAFDTK